MRLSFLGPFATIVLPVLPVLTDTVLTARGFRMAARRRTGPAGPDSGAQAAGPQAMFTGIASSLVVSILLLTRSPKGLQRLAAR